MARAQIATQVFVYALILMVVALIAVIGIRGVQNLLHKQCLVSIQSFKAELTKAIYETRDIGEARVFEARMPCGYTAICFMDRDYSSGVPPYQKPFVLENSNANNIFLIKYPQPIRADAVEPFNVSRIDLNQRYLCLSVSSGVLRIKLEGMGRQGTRISQY